MNTNELYIQYRQAIQLVRVGRYQEALNILQEIDAERPETKNVLYALAVCYEMLGRTEEALDLCERLIARHDHAKARLIKARIERTAKEPELPTVDLVSDLGIGKSGNTPAPAPAPKPAPVPKPAPAPAAAPAPQAAYEEDLPMALPASDTGSKDKQAKIGVKERPEKKGWFSRFSRNS